jgi:hypothetical protein
MSSRFNVPKPLTRYVDGLILLAGIVIILVTGLLDIRESFEAIGMGFGIGFVSASVLSFIHTTLGTDSSTLLSQVGTSLDVRLGLRDIGLDGIYTEIGNQDIFERFPTSKSIDLFFNTGQGTIKERGNALFGAIGKGCHVRMLMSDTNASFWKDEALIDGLCPGADIVKQLGEVDNSIDRLIEALDKSNTSSTKGSLEIRRYQGVPTVSMIIVDTRYARITSYLPKLHSSEVPTMDITKDRGGDLFERYQVSFDLAWESAQMEPARIVAFTRKDTAARNQQRSLRREQSPVKVAH